MMIQTMKKISNLIILAMFLQTSCVESLHIEEPVNEPDLYSRADTLYTVSFRLISSGNIDSTSVVRYNDSLQVRREEQIRVGEWTKSFSAKPGYALYISIKGAVTDGSVDLEVSVSDSLNVRLQKQLKNTGQGRKVTSFEYTLERVL